MTKSIKKVHLKYQNEINIFIKNMIISNGKNPVRIRTFITKKEKLE